MRIRYRPGRRSERITLNLASMIDVTFLLLVYFMIATVIAQQEDKLSPTLQTEQEDSAGQASDFTPQVIEVVVLDGQPAYRLGTRVMRERRALYDAIEKLPKDQGVFVKVADNVSVGFAVAAVQACRDAGFEQVTYVPEK